MGERRNTDSTLEMGGMSSPTAVTESSCPAFDSQSNLFSTDPSNGSNVADIDHAIVLPTDKTSDPHSERIEAALKLHPDLTPLMRDSFRRMYKSARRRTNECCGINNPNAPFTSSANNKTSSTNIEQADSIPKLPISHPVSSHYTAVTPTITHHYPGRLKEDLEEMKRGMISSTRGMTGAILWGEGLQVLLEGDTSGGLEMMAHAFLTGSGKGIHCVLNRNGRGAGKPKVEMTKNMEGVDACEAALMWVLGPDERGWAGGEYAGIKNCGNKSPNGIITATVPQLKCERVVLDGLLTKQELNGRVGVAFGEIHGSDRRKVKLDDDGRIVCAKPSNIFPMSSALIVDALAVASFLAMLECRTSVAVQLLSRALLEVANSEYTTWRGREGTMGRRVSLLEARCGCFTNLGLFENAIEDVEEALHLSPGSPGLVYIRAQTLRALARDGDVKLAAMSVHEMERFLELATATGGHENEVDALYCASMWAFEGIGRTDRRAYAHEGKRLFELAQRAERESGDINTSEVKRICEVYMMQTGTANSGGGRECHFCEIVTTDLKNCSKCKSAAYCSVGCQGGAWPQHKGMCARMAKELINANKR